MAIAIRKPAVSGRFYPAKKQELQKDIRQLLADTPSQLLRGRLAGLVVPHAGYMYSGTVAAYAYKVLADAIQVQTIDRVVMLGPAHSTYIIGMAGDGNQAWQTPIGATGIVADGFDVDTGAHKYEHSLEVQLPFLQEVLDHFEFLPLVVGTLPDRSSAALQILETLNDRTVLIISTDLSHFHSYETAVNLDHKTMESVLTLDPERFCQEGDACGENPILIALDIARKEGWSIEMLKYLNSGDITGDHTSVVGYASFAFWL